jgi:hypothetical protein
MGQRERDLIDILCRKYLEPASIGWDEQPIPGT